jgi:hypothetical protein
VSFAGSLPAPRCVRAIVWSGDPSAISIEVNVMIALRSSLGLVLLSLVLSGCGNFLGKTGEQMTDQPEKERTQARAVK